MLEAQRARSAPAQQSSPFAHACDRAYFGGLRECTPTTLMLRVYRTADQLAGFSRSLSSTAFAASQYGRTSEKCDVPAGHQNSDLRKSVCHIGLNRRRDLSLREDLCLFRPGSKSTVKEVFGVRQQYLVWHGALGHARLLLPRVSCLLQGCLVAVFGVPDMGPACSEKHVPSYLNNV